MTLPLQRSRFAQLGKAFYTELMPTPLQDPVQWGACNQGLAKELGLAEDFFASREYCLLLAGSAASDAYQVMPLASVYSGHQFGVWAGQLGDGRAILLGESVDVKGNYQEWQLKGAGRTPYSRFGDGRAVLRSSIREYLCSEAMYGLGIPTTRALALTVSPEPVEREEIETAAVVTRIAPSFIRFGHFEHFFHRGQMDPLKTLLDFVIDEYYPIVKSAVNPYAELFHKVLQSTAELVAAWQSVGFCHGVMNTDNMSILGLTIDYGPFGFLDAFDVEHICNHSDTQGRYAYQQQPYIAHWNLVRLANCFLPFVEKEELVASLDRFPAYFEDAYQGRMRAKLGLDTYENSDDSLIADLMVTLHTLKVDFTLFFRYLSEVSKESLTHMFDVQFSQTRLASLFVGKRVEDMNRWLALYAKRLGYEKRGDAERLQMMRKVNPIYILRNYLLQEAIEKAQTGNFSEIERLHRCIQQPFEEREEFMDYAKLPPSWAGDICVSCSS
ncbi:protein adenylyltransferase SelO [Pelistega suis]|uniref:protein adenylyltransferase SelO n=1 Tax=Pelistega suis TaxID=1631957 RepID=UPI00211CE2B9|nr:YdiU family protein [Pelistega suis]MCQ9327943.1 YdiU family protein [Pelistega suis]